MTDKANISICIPAYKRTEFLKRLLDSICIQTFQDFEVIVTDDSPGHEVKELCGNYLDRLPVKYYRNPSPLGTPENWNEAIRKASGQWIKLMHDDDWFSHENSLRQFADAINANPDATFFFCAYRDIFLQENRERELFINSFRYKALLKNTVTLFSKNVIGPPSVTLHRNDRQYWYDKQVKWVVDIEHYIRRLKVARPYYINSVLINVGIGSNQVTRDCFGNRLVEIPENFYLLQQTGVLNLQNILVYDAWWRSLRNLQITRESEIREAGYTGAIPPVILAMMRWQRTIPRRVLTTGVLSKLIMFIHYLLHRNLIRQ